MELYIPILVNSNHKIDLICSKDRKATGFRIKDEYKNDFTPEQVYFLQNDINEKYINKYIADTEISYSI
jgi:hypothetical protein